MSDEQVHDETDDAEAVAGFPITPPPFDIDQPVAPAPRGQRQRDIANALTGDAGPQPTGFLESRFQSGTAARPVEPETVVEYDPGNFTVEQVLAHVNEASDEDRQAILDLERAGKARKGILGD